MSITNASSASQNQLHIRQADAPELNIEYEVNPFPYSFPTTQKARHRLGENTDAGIHGCHLQRGALIHRLATGGAAKEKGKAAAAQGILRPAQFLRLIP